MPDEWERIRKLADRQAQGEGPGENATEREQHLYRLIEQLQSAKRKPEDEVAVLREPVGGYRLYLQRL